MTCVTRILPPDEWYRLDGTELETVWPHFSADTTKVFVVEDNGVIVGCWAVVLVPHAEGVWIASEHRGKGRIAKLLMGAMKAHVEAIGARAVYTASDSTLVEKLLRHLKAVKLPGDHFVFPVEEL